MLSTDNAAENFAPSQGEMGLDILLLILLLILLSISGYSLRNKIESSKFYYNFKRARVVSLYQSLGSTDWYFQNYFDDLNFAFDAFYSKIYFFIDQYVTLVKAFSRKYPPYMLLEHSFK